jgi:6-phosphogluconolactonase
MSDAEVRVYESLDELTRAAAEEVARAAERAVAERGRFTLALSGGSTPRPLYRLLASDPYRERLPWSAIHLFWGDERHVPPDHADSNFRMAREAMIDHVPVPPGNVHRVAAEDPDARRAAAAYESELRSFFGLAPGEQPAFDLLLLGIGPDGHTASLFPGSPAVNESDHVVVAPWVEAQRTFRITLTPPALNRGRLALFLVSGEDKADALHAVIEGEREPDRYPAQVVEGNRLWMVDRAAASRLKTVEG